ncbi:MAG: hypothetical protein JSU68_12075 [Phycisphaerales bacterium]|nr:MAG: hypothetical protein JSU68_12075 [Phycisphaerales bacterium]
MSMPVRDFIRPSLTLAMVCMPPAIGVTSGVALSHLPSAPQIESLILVMITALSMIMGLLIWLHVIGWTLRRVFGTAAAKATVLVHLALWHPVYDVGCMNDALIAAQGLVMLGLYWWFVPLIWWLGGRCSRSADHAQMRTAQGRLSMHRLPIDYLRSVALVPLASGLFVIVYMVVEDIMPGSWSDDVPWVTANALTAAVVSAGWVLTWRRGVEWNPLRRRHTVLLSLALVLSCGACGLIDGSTDYIDTLCLTIPLALAGLFMIATARLWQGPLAAVPVLVEEFVQPHCPACGYNMTGLDRARCPECGEAYTLEVLFAANVASR